MHFLHQKGSLFGFPGLEVYPRGVVILGILYFQISGCQAAVKDEEKWFSHSLKGLGV